MTAPVLQQDDDPVISGESRFGVLSAAGMLVLFLVFMVLEQAGVPDGIGYFLTGTMLAAAFIVSGVHARTSAIGDWQFSRRRAAPAILGMSLAATLITGNLFTGLPGSFFAASPAGPAWLLGPLAGLAACALLIAPFLRKSATGSPAGFFALRYTGLPVAAAAMLLVVAASLLMLASQLQVVGALSAIVFAANPVQAIAAAALIIAFAVVPGGLRGLVRTNALAYVIAATALLAPLVWISTIATKIPLPHLAYGAGALAETTDLEGQLIALGMRPLAMMTADGLPGAAQLMPVAALTLFLMLGFMAFPPLLLHFSAARLVKATRPAIAWSIGLAALILTAAPAVAAFAKLAIYDGIFGLTAGDIELTAGWVLDFSRFAAPLSQAIPLVTLCGAQVADTAAAVAACGGNPDYALSPADLAISGEVVVLALPEISQIPSVFTMALGAGAIAAALATANASAFALSSVRALVVSASGLVHLFAARMAIFAGIVLAAWLAVRLPGEPVLLAMWSLAICAGVLAPAFLLAIWWDRMNAVSAICGMCAGSFALCAVALAAYLGTDLKPVTGDEIFFAIAPLQGLPLPVHAATLALGASLAVGVAIAFATRQRPDPALLEQLRAPDTPAPGSHMEVS
jgi:cation/acetate symporter